MATASSTTFAAASGASRAAWLAAPAGRNRVPGVLLVDERVHAAASVAASLTEAGLACLAPELAGAGDGDVAGLADRDVVRDLDAALDHLAGLERVDPRRLAVVGVGAGGTYAFLLACRSTRVAALACLDAPLVYAELSARKPVQPLELALNLGAPLFYAGGSREEAAALERVLAQFALRGEVRVPAAGPGFLREGERGYDGAAAAATWGRTLEFLREELAPEGPA